MRLRVFVGAIFVHALSLSQLTAADAKLTPHHSQQEGPVECLEAPEGEYLKLCARFVTPSGRMQCEQAGFGRFFSSCALKICNRFGWERGALACINTVVDKSYNTSEFQFCNQGTSENQVLQCMATRGRSVLPSLAQKILDKIDSVKTLVELDDKIKALDELAALRALAEQL